MFLDRSFRPGTRISIPLDGVVMAGRFVKWISRHPVALALLVLFLLAMVILVACTRFSFTGDLEGIFLLKGENGKLLEVTDDIFLGDEARVLKRFELHWLSELVRPEKHKSGEADLHCDWSQRTGHGYIMSHFPDGSKLLTCFGRFKDSDGLVPKGLFVGGGLPVSRNENIEVTMNQTGMAFYDGKNWQHLWCSVNEALASAATAVQVPPGKWEFLGSRVLEENAKKVVIRSSHLVKLDNNLLRVVRHVIFRAGESYFTMVISIRNEGKVPAPYYYVYGDEPWVGEFGTSVGNVGWTADHIYYYEGRIDTQRYSYAGMYDYGNKKILGGKEKFSGMANFIEWFDDNRPELGYFSNRIGAYAEESEQVPLYSKDNRVIFLQWGPRLLNPGQMHYITLAIGMAKNDLQRNIPVKPQVRIDPADLKYLLQH